MPGTVLLLIASGDPGTTPNREGAAGMGAVTQGEGGFRYAPQTVAILAEALRQQGFAVQVLDAPALRLTLEQTLAALAAQQPELVCLQVSWATRQADQAFLSRCAGVVPTLAFGASMRWMREELASATWVLSGEPEQSLVAVVRRLLAGETLPHWLAAEALVETNDASSLAIPAWDLLPLERYNHLSISTSRGCDADCLWCPYVIAQGERFQPRPPESVLAELEALTRRYHPGRIIVRDPAFACDPERAKALCRLILRSRTLSYGQGLSWECESRPEHFDAELVRLLSLSGCIGIKVGLESVEPALLASQRRIHDPADRDAYSAQLEKLAQACHTWGVALRLYVMVGLPGQTVAGCVETARFAQALRPASLSIKRFELYPGLRGSYDVLPDEGEIEAHLAPLEQAQATIAAQPQPQPARWRRAAWRYGYRLIDMLHKGG